MRARLPWVALMALGLGRLRLSPESFWSMTPRELRAALPAETGAAPMDRAALDALMARHPDRAGEHSDD